MKTFIFLLFVVVSIVFIESIFGQPKSDYVVLWNKDVNVSKYLVFIDEGLSIVDSMDYLSPDVTSFKVGETSDTSFVISLYNDGNEVIAGVVGVNVSGFYSPMGVSAILRKEEVLEKPKVIFKVQ